MDSGVYYIKNLINNKIYIGQSKNVKDRLSRHKSKLKYKKHENSYLQRAVNKYGIDNFEFKIIEFVDFEILDEREIYWINFYNSTLRSNGYNIEGGGVKNKEVSEEMRINKLGMKNPMYGKHHTGKVIKKMTISSRGMNNKLSVKDVETIKIALCNGESQKTLAKKYNVDHTTINKIQTGVNWGYIKADLNAYLKEQNKLKIKETHKNIQELYKKGVSISEIVNKYGYDYRTVNKVTGKSVNQLIKERNKKVGEDFLKGMSKEQIMKKYNLSEHMYKDATKDVRDKKETLIKANAILLRKQGMTVKDISILLGKHRTTITKWTKDLC